MKIAFVGKGGSGKTSHAALFIHTALEEGKQVFALDGDINMHLPGMFGADPRLVRHVAAHAEHIKNSLLGTNSRIEGPAAMKKTTPPGRGSRLLSWESFQEEDLADFVLKPHPRLHLAVVGTYEEEAIGATCYHNHLSIAENILSHFWDPEALLVMDMVAGTDAFASSLHAQFDLLVLQVEATGRGLEVYDQFVRLAEAGGVLDRLRVVGNKIRTPEEETLVRSRVDPAHLFALIPALPVLHQYDMEGTPLDPVLVRESYGPLGKALLAELRRVRLSPAEHLRHLYQLHTTYVAQAFVQRAHGDLTGQIDPDFDFPTYA